MGVGVADGSGLCVGGCGVTPGWLEYNPLDKSVYCFDESWQGSGVITNYAVATDGKLTQKATQKTAGRTVHGTLYGGSQGKSFIATAE